MASTSHRTVPVRRISSTILILTICLVVLSLLILEVHYNFDSANFESHLSAKLAQEGAPVRITFPLDGGSPSDAGGQDKDAKSDEGGSRTDTQKEASDDLSQCDWAANTSTCIHKSSILEGSDKIVVSLAVRTKHLACIESRILEMREYARRVGADFVFVDDADHESLKDACPGISPRYYKIWIIRHYLGLYKEVLYLDETQRMTSCAPDLFAMSFNRTNVLVAEENVDRSDTVREACKQYKVNCSSYVMFNSGLMLYNSESHARMFETWNCSLLHPVKGSPLEDQPFFNALLMGYDVGWTNLNADGKVILQGSEVKSLYVKDKPVKSPILHITKGADEVRDELLCQNWNEEVCGGGKKRAQKKRKKRRKKGRE
mmetsp:Transcript_4543/g.11853  ORF Transcript_4543/g.11853 Transcript_4543/m.11853 type:complete len:374 (-) Transcript_4543:22-1143(-)